MMVGGEEFVYQFGWGILPGEGVRPRRMSGENVEFSRHFRVTKYVITCYTWTLVDGGIFREVVRPRRREGKNSSVEFVR